MKFFSPNSTCRWHLTLCRLDGFHGLRCVDRLRPSFQDEFTKSTGMTGKNLNPQHTTGERETPKAGEMRVLWFYKNSNDSVRNHEKSSLVIVSRVSLQMFDRPFSCRTTVTPFQTQTIYKWQESEFVFPIFGLWWKYQAVNMGKSQYKHTTDLKHKMTSDLLLQQSLWWPRSIQPGQNPRDATKESLRRKIQWFSLKIWKRFGSPMCHDALVFFLELKKGSLNVSWCTDFLFENWKRFANVSCTDFLFRTEKGSPMCHDALIFFKNGKRFTPVSWCTSFLFRTDKGSPMCHALIFS